MKDNRMHDTEERVVPVSPEEATRLLREISNLGPVHLCTRRSGWSCDVHIATDSAEYDEEPTFRGYGYSHGPEGAIGTLAAKLREAGLLGVSDDVRTVLPENITIADVQEAVRAGLADMAAEGVKPPYGFSVPDVVEALCIEATRDIPEIAEVWGRPSDSFTDRRDPGVMYLQEIVNVQEEVTT